MTPFDVSVIHDLQKGIEAANAGLNPIIDGNVLRIKIPPLISGETGRIDQSDEAQT